MSYKAIAFSLLIVISVSLHAQNSIEFKVLDENSRLPVTEVSYQYGKTQGISNNQGIFHISIQSGQSLLLSHAAYEAVEIYPDSLLDNNLSLTIFLKPKNIQLYPVSIIAVHQNASQKLGLNQQDHLHHDGGAILAQQTGINGIQKSGSYGFDPVIRGFKYEQLNIVMNGLQSAIAACPNRMDPPSSQMAPNMSERIEIYKGPYALRFGTGLGATVNFVGSVAQYSSQTDVYGRLSGAWESNGSIYRSEALLGLKGKSYNWGLYGAWSEGDDYEDGDNQKVNSEFQRSSIGSHLNLKLSAKHQFGISLHHNEANDTEFPALPMDLRNDDTWMTKASHLYLANSKHLQKIETSMSGTWVDHEMDNLSKLLEPRKVNATTKATTTNYAIRSEASWLFNQNRMYTGIDFKREAADGTRYREFLMGPKTGQTVKDNVWQDSYITKTGLFGEYHINKTKWIMILAARLDFNHAEAKDISQQAQEVNGSSTHDQINPSVSFGINRSLSPSTNMGIWLGRAQRSGSLTERFINSFPVGKDSYEMIGNPQLHPEINNQMDLRLQVKKKIYQLNFDVFAAYINNYISSQINPDLSPAMPTSPGVRQFSNLDKALQYGFEATWQQKLSSYLNHECSMAFTYGKDLDDDKPLPEIAPMDIRYKLHLNLFNQRFKTTLDLRQVMEQNRVSSSFGETRTDHFFLANIFMHLKVNTSLSCRMGLYNVFDETYHEHLSRLVKTSGQPINAPGRNLSLSVHYQF
ncbi:MAG: TonB-dependent receptor [Marinifilum sp.]|jgi:iron complex outermembrane receptor protein|nr:TonB-dependent receptor [Marinifilum sp.]